MTDPMRIGLAGYGVVGRRRRQVIDQHPRARVTAVCDRVFTQAGQVEGAQAYPDYHELLRQDLDALFVCLPNDLAPAVTIAGLERGLHVFCEKPPGRDLADIVQVRAVERLRPELKLMYGFNHRYHDSVQDALRLARSGELGRVLNLRGVYGKSAIIRFDSDWRTRRAQAGGGILLDQGIHLLDLMRLFAGEFTQVHSFVSNSFWGHDVEDNAYALLRTAEGVVAMLHSSATQWRHRFQLDITLERGGLALAGILSGSKSYGAETLTVIYPSPNDAGDPREQMTRYNDDHSWRDEVFEFIDTVLTNRPVTHGPSLEALKTMELVYRIYCADPDWRARYQLDDRLPEGA